MVVDRAIRVVNLGDPRDALRALQAKLTPEQTRQAGLTGASVVREDREHAHRCDQRLDEVLGARERREAVAVLRQLAGDAKVPEHRKLLITALADGIDVGAVRAAEEVVL